MVNIQNKKGGYISLLRIILPIIALSFLLPCLLKKSLAEEAELPTRYGLAIVGGNTYSPENDITFALLSGFILFDYEKVWHHKAPDPLRFKVEFNAGVTTRPETRAVISSGILALYYLRSLTTNVLRPYIEGGIGIIYTDFQVKGQGLRFNFNPQMGIGTEFKTSPNVTFFSALRLHHISNAGLHHENRGINSVVLMLGRYF
jgi:lipid A 3-O-deacylase